MAAAVRLTCGSLQVFDQRTLREDRLCRRRQGISKRSGHPISQGIGKGRSDVGQSCKAANYSYRGGMVSGSARSTASGCFRSKGSHNSTAQSSFSSLDATDCPGSLHLDHSWFQLTGVAHPFAPRLPHRSVTVRSSLSSPTKGAESDAQTRSYGSKIDSKPRHFEAPVTVQRPSVKKAIYKSLEDSPSKVEMCCIVDEGNNVVGEATRADTVGKRLWGRGVYCLVQNTKGQLLVTQRTEEKDLYPGHLDVVVSGCVNVGEEYSDTVVRELSEELGLHYVDRSTLTPLFLFKWVDEYCRIWGCGYHYVTDAETFNLQVEEVQWCKWMDLDQVEELIQTARFTPVGLSVLRRFLKERQLAQSH